MATMTLPPTDRHLGTDPRIWLAAWRASDAPTHKSRVFSTSPGCVGRLRRTWFLAGSLVASILAGCWSQFRCLLLYWRSTNHGASCSLSGPIGRDRSHAAGCDLVSRGRVCVFPCQSSALHHYRGMLLSTLRNRGASSARSGIEGAKSSSLSFRARGTCSTSGSRKKRGARGTRAWIGCGNTYPRRDDVTGPAACGELHFSRCSQGVALGALAAAGRRRWRSPLSLSPHRSCFWAM